MAGKKDGHRLLQKYRSAAGLSKRAAARELGVTHVGYLPWEKGTHSPSLIWRDAIERWSDGAVPASSWPLSEREIRDIERSARVVPRNDS